MTPIRALYIRGLHLASMAASLEARNALAIGNAAEWLCRSQHAAQLTEDARILAGDTEALLDRTARVLDDAELRDWEMKLELREMRHELEIEALDAAREALTARRRG